MLLHVSMTTPLLHTPDSRLIAASVLCPCCVCVTYALSGSVTAVDRTANKVAKIKQQASRFGLTNIRTVVADSTEALPARSDGEAGVDDGDDDDHQQPELYDRVILDPTCSALGIRPRLSFAGVTPDYLKKTAAYQRKLMHAAVAALKPGGTLVYSTCTVGAPPLS